MLRESAKAFWHGLPTVPRPPTEGLQKCPRRPSVGPRGCPVADVEAWRIVMAIKKFAFARDACHGGVIHPRVAIGWPPPLTPFTANPVAPFSANPVAPFSATPGLPRPMPRPLFPKRTHRLPPPGAAA